MDQELSWGSVVVSGRVVPEGILVVFWGNFINTFSFFLFVGRARLPLYCGWGALPPQAPPQLRACFKRDQPCAAGAAQLQSQLSVLTECERPDPFKDISESDIEDAVDENYTVDNEGEDDDIIDIDIV